MNIEGNFYRGSERKKGNWYRKSINSTLTILKTTGKLEIEDDFDTLTKNICTNIQPAPCLMVKEWMPSSQMWRTRQECKLLLLLFNIGLEVVVKVIEQEKKINYKPSTLTNDVCVCVRPQEIFQNMKENLEVIVNGDQHIKQHTK